MLRDVLCRLLLLKDLGLARIRYRVLGFDHVVWMVHDVGKPSIIPLLRAFRATIGQDCDIERGLTIHNAEGSFQNLIVEDDCHIGQQVLLDLKSPITLRAGTTLSMRVSVITHMDMGHAWLGQEQYKSDARPVSMGPHAYVGASATILKGISIGEGAIVAAGAVVVSDVPPGSLVAGVPARQRSSHESDH